MKTIIVSLLLASSLNCISQEWLMAKSYGPGEANEPFSMGTDKDNNLYVIGRTYKASHGSSPYNYHYRLFSKFDATGSLLWQDTLPGDYLFKHASTDVNGNTYLLSGNRVIKFNATGEQIWLKYDPDGIFTCLAFHPSGDLILSGEFINSTKSILARYDSMGNRLWIKNTGLHTVDRFPNQIACDKTGDIVFSGAWDSSQTSDSCMLAKLDENGTFKFRVNIPKYARTLNVDQNGNIYTGGLDYLVKHGSDGVRLWLKKMTSSVDISRPYVTLDLEGNIILAGFYGKNANIDGVDLVCTWNQTYVAKFSPGGQLIWLNETSGDNGSVSPTAVHVNKSNELVFIGTISARKTLGAFTLQPPSSYPHYLISKMALTAKSVDVQENALPSEKWLVYPNPTSSHLVINTIGNESKTASIRVLNMLGQVVYAVKLTNLGSNDLIIPVDNFQKGSYIISITDDAGHLVKKVIIN